MSKKDELDAGSVNAVAAEFCLAHPGWDVVLDDEGHVIFISSPLYEFTREESEQG